MRELFGDAAAGDEWVWVRLTVADGRIVDASGEGPGTSDILRALRGLTPLDATRVPGARLAADALATALEPAVEAPADSKRVAVAMSGGVDSAVALLHARAEGYEPVGVTLRLWIDPAGPDTDRACCAPSAVIAARELCHNLGVAHVTVDARSKFRQAVVVPFVRDYAAGTTPNPCVRCNGSLRFDELLAFAGRVGAARLATGHYARIVRHRGRLLVGCAADAAKDQSYMLGQVDPEILPRLWFPLGNQSKAQTRAQARADGLAAAERAESQEACFLGGDDYRTFLSRHGQSDREGPVIDLEGREVGRHSGYWRFTPGQRRGLRVAAPDGPLYALGTIPARNAVIVGPRGALARTRVGVRDGRLHVPVRCADAKLRYRSPAVRAKVDAGRPGFSLELEQPVEAVAPGQAAVLYEEGAIVGAGSISWTA